jgi:hypothetical protein
MTNLNKLNGNTAEVERYSQQECDATIVQALVQTGASPTQEDAVLLVREYRKRLEALAKIEDPIITALNLRFNFDQSGAGEHLAETYRAIISGKSNGKELSN